MRPRRSLLTRASGRRRTSPPCLCRACYGLRHGDHGFEELAQHAPGVPHQPVAVALPGGRPEQFHEFCVRAPVEERAEGVSPACAAEAGDALDDYPDELRAPEGEECQDSEDEPPAPRRLGAPQRRAPQQRRCALADEPGSVDPVVGVSHVAAVPGGERPDSPSPEPEPPQPEDARSDATTPSCPHVTPTQWRHPCAAHV